MSYRVEFAESALKDLKKMDKGVVKLLFSWITKNLNGTNNPRNVGKGLSGEKKGLWRYRIGDYRIICHIQDDKLLILVVDAGHRKEIYE